MSRRGAAACLAVALLWAGTLDAHTAVTGLAAIRVAGRTVHYTLALVVGELPADAASLLARAAEGDEPSVSLVAEAMRTRVGVRADGAPCRPGGGRIQGSALGDGRITLAMEFVCPASPARLTLRDDWADLFGEHYRTLARVDAARATRELAFLPDRREVEVALGASRAYPDPSYLWLGMEHILTGYDHLLFLAALLIRGGRPWALARIVTAFTLAHSATLGLAAAGLVTLSARIVEPAIAASIVWVALENILRPRASERRWLVAFGFGLVHGLAFADALGELGLPAGRLALALLGFNLGVEAGQALVVAALLPLLLWLRTRTWEARATRIASVAVAALGAVWFVERLFLS